jgi:peptide/nickel transport system permease protein
MALSLRGLWQGAAPVLKLVPSLAITFLGLILVTFIIGRIVPIDPVLAVVGDRASPDVYDRVRLDMGLDLPIWRQFWIYLLKILSGDFGTAVLTAKPVLDDIKRVFPATLELATVATIIGAVIGIPLGVIAATKQGRWQDHVVRVISLFGQSIPTFWLALIGLLVFYAKLDLVPGPGRINIAYMDFIEPITGVIVLDALLQGEWDAAKSAARHLILPSFVLAYFSIAFISRMTRSFMIEQLKQEYITAARVKGASEFRVVWGHAFRNIAAPLCTVMALSYANLLEGSVLTETVFSWPGLGQYITNSLLTADMNAVLGGTIVVGFVFVTLNLLADLLYRTLDPRSR